MNGTIIQIKAESVQYGVSGVKGKHPYQRTSDGYYNGWGAFMSYPERQLNVYWRTDNGKVQSQDIRSFVLSSSGRKKITSQYVSLLNKANVGNRVSLKWDNEQGCRCLAHLFSINIPE